MGESPATSSRQPVTFDPATRLLAIGGRSTVVPEVPDSNEAMLRGYLALVAQARGTAVASLTEVRQQDVVVLAQLLDLEDVDLEARFVRLLGMSPEMAADTRRRIAMHRAMLGAAGVTVGLLMSAGGGGAATRSSVTTAGSAPISAVVEGSSTTTTSTTSVPSTTNTTTAPASTDTPSTSTSTPATTTARPASQQSPSSSTLGEVEIGDALVIERGTQPDDPNVQIGDAETIER